MGTCRKAQTVNRVRVGLTLFLAVSAFRLAESTARADGGKLFHLVVERAALAPTKPNGRNWDTTPVESAPSADDGTQAALIEAAIKAAIKKAMDAASATPETLLISIGVMVGKYGLGQLGNAIAYPDATGQLYVDNRLVATLDIVKDTYSPAWTNESAPLLLNGNERIRLLLIDKDTIKGDDQLGECTLTLGGTVAANSLLMSECSGSVFGAAISIRESANIAGPPTIEAGPYQVESVAIGVASRRPGTNSAWDTFGGQGNPDPVVTIDANGQTYLCDMVKDAFKATCNPRNLFVVVGEDTTLHISVADVDRKLSNDQVGTASISGLIGRNSHQMLPMATTGGLQFASIQFGPTDASNLPPIAERLNRADIATGIAQVKGRVATCGDEHAGKGTVKVKIRIGPDGEVHSADGSGGSAELRSCVVAAVRSATFKPTQLGTWVTYPFMFRESRP